jgi:hypothetical protein
VPVSGYTEELYETFTPAGGACIEGTVIRERVPGDTTKHFFAIEDWCTAGAPWLPFIGMNAAFQGKYVRTMSGKSAMTYAIVTTSIIESPQCWYIDVYNWSLGGWEQFWSKCGTNVRGNPAIGWVAWEAYDVTDVGVCPSIKGISAMDIQFYDASLAFGTAAPITDSTYTTDVNANFGSFSCLNTGTYTFTYPWSSSPINSWTMATPNP